jgi:hypothetical protein
MIDVVAHVWFSQTNKLAPRYKFFVSGADLNIQS